uniref:Mab-21-like HhH/H2TH-like domain-containing protein n=1 Tax=Accipiter nisus TaxID=211598 RepID=A0A8B9NH84_9AVES
MDVTLLFTKLVRSILWNALQELAQSGFAWGALLFGALQQWQFWAIAGVLLLLFGLCWWLRKRSHEVDGSRDEESSSSDREQVEEEAEEDSDSENDLGSFFVEHIQWPLQNLARDCQVVKGIIDDFILIFRTILSNTFFPVLQPAIGVGSAFEGWSPRKEHIIYCLLVPLMPPHGHTFHLELSNRGERPARNFRVRVEVECTCRRELVEREMFCYLHRPEEEPRSNQVRSVLHTLCTGSYLDVQKTAHWFQNLVRSAWALLALQHPYNMTVLPSSRSCKLQLTNTSRRTLFIEIVFGVQQGNSDIFVSSQNTEAIFTPSTTWPESYAVAEAKFFRHMARQVPHDRFHLRCLQDIMQYLRRCLEEKRLDHFFFGNERVPEEIILPRAFQMAEPLNLFQHLVQDPATH